MKSPKLFSSTMNYKAVNKPQFFQHKKDSTSKVHITNATESMYLEVKRMSNKLAESQQEVARLRAENRTLLRVQKIQDKNISKMNTENENFPKMMDGLYDELRLAKTQMKKYQESLAQNEKSLRDIHGEYTKQRTLNERLNALLRSKNLQDTDTLLKRIHKLEEEIMEKEDTIADLQYKIEEMEYKAKMKRAKDAGSAEPTRPKPPSYSARHSRQHTSEVSFGKATVHVSPEEIPRADQQEPASAAAAATTPLPTIGETTKSTANGSQANGIASAFPSLNASPVPAANTSSTNSQQLASQDKKQPVTDIPQKSILKPKLKK